MTRKPTKSTDRRYSRDDATFCADYSYGSHCTRAKGHKGKHRGQEGHGKAMRSWENETELGLPVGKFQGRPACGNCGGESSEERWYFEIGCFRVIICTVCADRLRGSLYDAVTGRPKAPTLD